ncbi:MAG: zinc-binding dehydrogenase [Acidimicrobiales bacterium]
MSTARPVTTTSAAAVAGRGVALAAARPDDRILVIGAGTIGLLAAAKARQRNGEVTIVARHDHQAEAASQLGIDSVSERDVHDWARESRPNIVIETVGGTTGDSLALGIRLVARGGRIVVLGTFLTIEIEMLRTSLKEVTIVPSFAYGHTDGRDDFREAAASLVDIGDRAGVLVSHRFPLEAVAAAFDAAADKSTGAIKVAVLGSTS